MNVWVVTYEHRHGSDVYTYPTEADAEEGACAKIMEWIDEITDTETSASIQELIKGRMFKDAISEWEEYQCETPAPESLSIRSSTVDFALSHEDLIDLREMLLNLEKKYPEVLFDGILKDLDLDDKVFERIMAKINKLTEGTPDEG
jgi:hypothetical protein